MSSKQFSQTDVVEKVEEVLAETQLQTYNLKLEITESVLIENSVSIVEQLLRIRELGIKLSIDDFGTGYSSFLRPFWEKGLGDEGMNLQQWDAPK